MISDTIAKPARSLLGRLDLSKLDVPALERAVADLSSARTAAATASPASDVITKGWRLDLTGNVGYHTRDTVMQGIELLRVAHRDVKVGVDTVDFSQKGFLRPGYLRVTGYLEGSRDSVNAAYRLLQSMKPS